MESRLALLTMAAMRRPTLAFAIALLLAFPLLAADSAAGKWTGSIALSSGKLDIELELHQNDAGRWKGSISIPSQQAFDLPLDLVEVTAAGKVSFRIANIPGGPRFAGTLAGDSIEGTYTQDGTSSPFAVHRQESTSGR
jgi:hypothetical protein